MRLPSVKDLSVEGKRVLVRTNYDIPPGDTTRIEESLPTINYLLQQRPSQIIIISHWGRPEGKVVPKLSLRSVANYLKSKIPARLPRTGGKNQKSKIQLKIKIQNFEGFKITENLVLLENLRFFPEEEANDLEFAKKLASLGDFYINEAFACSHRNHASIIGVPQFFPPSRRAFGFDFLKEVAVLQKIRENPRRPVVLLLGGVKKDKIEYAKKLISWADWILVGGKLVEYDGIPQLIGHQKILGNLLKSGQDITIETAKEFAKIIRKAKTVVWAGPMGNFYDKRYFAGTKIVAQAVAESRAFSVVGGGDTEAALSQLGLIEKISFVSSGGGAMLEFLAEGTLPGIEAVVNS